MSHQSVDELIEQGLSHQEAGRGDLAKAVYQRILATRPDHADALYLLGVIAAAEGQYESAFDLIGRAIAADGDNPDYHCDLGNLLQRRDQTDKAIACYQKALELDDQFVEAHYNLGHAWDALGQLDKAITCYQRAIELDPALAAAHTNLGNALRKKGHLDQAIACHQRALELQPELLEAHVSLGVAWQDKGQLDQAIACYQRALALKPDQPKVQCNLGNTYNQREELDPAIACYQKALLLDPDMVEAHNGLGTAWRKKGDLDQAIACHRRALELNPNSPESHNNLGIALKDKGQIDQAIASYQRAIAIKGDLAEAHSNLGVALAAKGLLDQAIACYQQALLLKPDFVHVHNNLGNAWKDKGRLDDAIACYRRALTLDPGFVGVHDNLLYVMHYHQAYDAQSLYAESRRWNQQHAEGLRQYIRPHANDRDPERPLRVGYVSADFHDHCSALFLLPLLTHHDRGQFDVTCYAQGVRSDDVTRQLREQVQGWRNTVGLSDGEFAQLVRDDRIDILVDLKVHTAENRLLVFARKPAPVQVTWLGYPGTTGLDTVDYRLTDPYLDPPGLFDGCYSERSIRLPSTFWCYDPLCNEPLTNSPPCRQNGFITFGCLNNFCKLNDAVISLWAKLLMAVPRSRLVLLASEGDPRTHVRERLRAANIAPDRVDFVGKQSRPQYLRTYHTIDMALDTFPCNGHTTSLDSLWMGVPVITLVGNTPFGRAGLSQLSNLGLAELIAHRPEEYLQIAAGLAGDPARLADLRATLRQRMEHSPLMDGASFARGVESAYRTMWRTWCQKQG